MGSQNQFQNKFVSNESLIARKNLAVPDGAPAKSGIYVERAQGAELWDVDGKRYIDFIAGIGVLNIGHCHPKVIEAARDQLQRFTHTAFGVAQYEPYILLAERLNALVSQGTVYKSFLLNSGAEATEQVCKIARRITGRPGLIAFEGAFHGRTLLSTALTGKSNPYKIGFGPLPGDVFHAPYPDAYRGRNTQDCLAALERMLNTITRPEDVAAIIIEPVQGEGGFVAAPPEFLRRLKALCEQDGILFIADEVQTGFARTGKMFAIEHAGIEPDFLICAKSIAGGLPLSAITGKAALFDQIPAGAIGSTFGGNPVACAAALAVLEVIEEEGLIARAEEIGAHIETRWREMARDIAPDHIGDIRRTGAMAALEIVNGGQADQPNGALAGEIQRIARNKGLLFLTAGLQGQVLRTHVPLIISDKLLDEGLDLFAETLIEAIKSDHSGARKPIAETATGPISDPQAADRQ